MMNVNEDVMKISQELMEYLLTTMCTTKDENELKIAKDKAKKCVDIIYEMKMELMGKEEDPCIRFVNKVMGYE